MKLNLLYSDLLPHDTLVYMKHTKFERARIIGARSLQISMGAPVIIDVPKEMIDPVDIAILEYDNRVIPITIVS